MGHKTWFITGTSSGFGRLLTERLLERGDRVAATLRSPSVLDGLRERYGQQLWVAALDVTDSAAIRRAVDEAFTDLGRIDVIVNNAGYGLFGAIEEVSDEQIRHQLDTNIVGSLQVVRAALPHLRRQGGGGMLQVSSYGGQMAAPGTGLYHASKWAVEGFCESLAAEVAPFGISVTIVEPGSASTGFRASLVGATPIDAYEKTVVGEIRRRRRANQLPTVGDPEKIVTAMIRAIDSDKPPLRLALGSDSYKHMHAALTERLRQLEAQQAIALSTDIAI